MKAGARWYRTGSAITCDTAGGRGVGPAVIRYSLMYGFAGIRRARIPKGPGALWEAECPESEARHRLPERLGVADDARGMSRCRCIGDSRAWRQARRDAGKVRRADDSGH